MKLFGVNFSLSRKGAGGEDIDAILQRLHAVYQTVSGITVTPETCMEAPTVQAIVSSITRRVSTLNVQVLRKTKKKGRSYKEPLESHPVARLLATPNDWQTDVNYWQDNMSWLARYGRFISYKARGKTGPILDLVPLHPRSTDIKQNPDTMELTFDYTSSGGKQTTYSMDEVLFARGPSRDASRGDSPVNDVRETIALEIAAERFGSSFFGNGAMPFMIFKFMQGVKGFKNEADKKEFIQDFQESFNGSKRFRAMALPVGLDASAPIAIDNDKAQFLDTRKYQRTVIAGAWGVPPHLVGDLERATFNNVEQQGIDFTISVILPYVRTIEAALERALLTPKDRASGVIIRFNLESALRGDFKSRQEGLQIQRQNGIINANEWREYENLNPIGDDEGGETYIIPLNFQASVSSDDLAASDDSNPDPGATGDPSAGDDNIDPGVDSSAKSFMGRMLDGDQFIKRAQKLLRDAISN